MPIRPVDRDALADACRSVAQDEFGFVYVDRDRERIESEYESSDKSLVHADSLSKSDIEETLSTVASEETSSIERIRNGVFYVDPFGRGIDMGVAEELQELFRNQIVVTTEDLRQHFDLAVDDAEFFAEELRSGQRGLVMRIVAGNRSYYTVGPKLKDHVAEGGEDLEDKLVHESLDGKISHGELEDAIAVSAVSDVIGYLQTEGYVVDLDGEYLVPAAIEEYTRWLAGEIADDVVDAFQSAGYVMPVAEYDSLLTEEIERRSNVLSAVRSSRGDLSERDVLRGVRERFDGTDNPEIERDDTRGLAVHVDPADETVESHADEVVRPVLNETTAQTPSSLLDSVRPEIEELRLASTTAANEYLRERITERADELIRDDFASEAP